MTDDEMRAQVIAQCRVEATQIVAIDIGVVGALALLTDVGDLLGVEDMPVLEDGPAGRKAINGPLLADIVRHWAPAQAFVESVGARPKEGPVGAFAFGRSRGVIEGVLAHAGVPITWLSPPAWKRLVGLTLASKDAARSEAIRRWPDRAKLFERVKDDGRAEACLIGVAGLAKQAREAA